MQSCNHGCNSKYKTSLCPTSNKNFLVCTECPKHVPALQYLKEHHEAKEGWNNLHFLKGAFGSEA